MKKKGFTLIELIVVIAIIGVLAAILVPAMLGYVRKSKITTANTTAKSIYNAFNTALVDLDTIDASVSFSDGSYSGSAFNDTASDQLVRSVYGYFSDVAKVSSFYVDETDGACTGCGVLSGKYPGAYPIPWTVDGYKSAASASQKPASAEEALSKAETYCKAASSNNT